MEENKLFELYEKLYFHEVESRDKISARLQIPLAITLTILGVIANIVKGLSFSLSSVWCYLFWILFGLGVVLFTFAVTKFIRSFYGHSYQFLPPACDTEKYRLKLIDTYKDYDEGEQLSEKYFNEYLYRYYNECSSKNTKINDYRSETLHKCNTYLILCALPLAVAFLTFTFGGIDKHSKDKEYKVKITNSFVLPKEIHVEKEPFKQEVVVASKNNSPEKVITDVKRTTETTTTPASSAAEESHKGGCQDTETTTTTKTKT